MNTESGKPLFLLSGETAAYLEGKKIHLSLSHEVGIASAMVVIEE